MKTKEELNAMKEEVEAVGRRLRELTEDEFAQVTGGIAPGRTYWLGNRGANKANPPTSRRTARSEE